MLFLQLVLAWLIDQEGLLSNLSMPSTLLCIYTAPIKKYAKDSLLIAVNVV